MIPGSANPLLLKSAAAASYQIERSLRFNSSDSGYLSRTPAVAGNRTTFTWAGWVKRSTISDSVPVHIFSAGTSGASNVDFFGIETDNTIRFGSYNGSAFVFQYITTQVFRDPSAWYHLVLAVDTTIASPSSDRVKFYVNGVRVTTFSTATDPGPSAQCAHFNTTSTHYLGKFIDIARYFPGYLADIHFIDGQALTPSSFTEVSATTGQLIPKAYTGSFGTNGFWLQFADNSNNTATTLGKDSSGNNNNWTPNNFSVTGLVDHTPAGLSYRDSSTTNRNWDQSTASSTTSAAIGPDRIYWIDLGSSKSFNRVTFSVVASGQSSDTSTNFITYFSTSSSSTGSSICGSGCTVTKAGSPSGTTPGTITVTFAGFASQNGRYIGIASGSGAQGGTYTYSNFKVYDDQGAANDSLVDTPTSYGTDTGAGGEVRGNYATFNALALNGNTLSNGNLDYLANANNKPTLATIGIPASGKWYIEITDVNSGSGSFIGGVGTASANVGTYLGTDANGWSYQTHSSNAGYFNNNTFTTTGRINGHGSNTILGIAIDRDAQKIWFAINGTFVNSGAPASGTNSQYSNLPSSGELFPGASTGSSQNIVFNAGQRAFAYTAPSGFKALCDTNLTSTTITTSGSYTGNGTADGPFVYLNGVPTAMTVGGNAVTFGTHADKLSNGFKIRTSSTTYNQNASSYNYSITSTGAAFKNARAQPNP